MAEEARDSVEETANELRSDNPHEAVSLGIEDAMARLSLGRAHVYRLVNDGILKASKNDAGLAFSESNLAAAAEKLAERREKVVGLLCVLAAKLAEHGIEADADESVKDVEAGVGEVTRRLLLASMAAHGSDVYVMPVQDGDRILVRVGGKLQELARLERELGNLLKEKLKAMAPLSDAEAGEGSAAVFRHADEHLSAQVRMNVLPTLAGEQLHLQFFHANVARTFDAIGYSARHSGVLQNLLAGNPGLFVLAGSQCHFVQEQRLALAAYLCSLGKLVVSIDRAPNYLSEGVIHLDGRHAADADVAVPWQTAIGMTPDIILVDRLADCDQVGRLLAALTAGITVLVNVDRATGAAALQALTELGLEQRELHRYFRAATEFVVIPRLCPDCRESRAMGEDEAQALGEPAVGQLYGAVGCDHCEGGYRGSMPVWGLLLEDDLEATISPDGEALLIQKGGEPSMSDTSLASALKSAVLAGDATFDHTEPFLR